MDDTPEAAVRWLRTPEAIRERCGQVFERGVEGRLEHFAVDLDQLPELADRVAEVTRRRFPDLAIPPHGRWAHFRAGDTDRVQRFRDMLGNASEEERGRAAFDLVVTSVLLDAGAGADWRYREEETGLEIGRSEGLAVASFHAFTGGLFSSHPDQPLRADAAALEGMTEERLGEAFQASDDNFLVGLAGRVQLLRRLGEAVRTAPEAFGDDGRLGGLFDHLRHRAQDGELPAPAVLTAVLEGLGSIWPGRISLGGRNLGDVWRHPAVDGTGHAAGLVPFHKLSQWLTYSLVEPLGEGGVRVTGLNDLTGLAEYRNGGLFVDGEVLLPKDPAITTTAHDPSAEPIVEWRALTVVLLDRVADLVRERLGRSAEEMPLAQVIEGGTWHAGRELAREKRPDGTPPIAIQSDGTVF